MFVLTCRDLSVNHVVDTVRNVLCGVYHINTTLEINIQCKKFFIYFLLWKVIYFKRNVQLISDTSFTKLNVDSRNKKQKYN